MTAKVMFGAIGGIILIVGLFAFETIRTGSPAEVMFADQLITGAQVAAGVVVGIVGVNMAQKSVGWHHVVYETESGDVQTESVPINVSGMEADTEGNAVVSEYARTRVLGLFRRTKHVAEDATLDGTHRAPGKPIKHQIPARDRDRRERVDHADGQTDADSEPGRGGGLCLQRRRSSYLRQVRRYERIEPPKGHSTHVAGVDRRGPRKELEKLERRLKSGQYKEEQQVLQKIEQVSDIISQASSEPDGQSNPRDTHVNISDAKQNGSGQAATDGGTQ